MRKVILAIILLMITTSSHVDIVNGQVVGDTVVIVPDGGYEYEGVASSKLVWPEGKQQTVTLNLTQTILPNNISRIFIDVIAFEIIGNIEGIETPVDATSITPEIILSESNKTAFVNQTMFPPDLTDEFFLNITMLVGTSFNREARRHVVRFPDEGTILVDRDRLVPLVNLYGFPPSSFFSKFLPIYTIIVVVLILPGLYYSVNKFRRSNKKRPVSDLKEVSNLD